MHDQQEPVTLRVAHLPSSTSFYLSALQPLGYRFLHQLHDSSGALSQAIGLGPEAGHRVDLYLAEARRNDQGRSRANAKRAHVVFPACTPIAVRNFYHAALNAGGRPVRAPDTLPGGDELYSATVTDIDGNKVEVCYSGPLPAEPSPGQEIVSQPEDHRQNRSIGRWAEDVASTTSSVKERRNSISAAVPPIPAMPPMCRTTSNRSAQSRTTASSTRPRAMSGASHSRQPAATSPKSVDMSSKAVVGTLFGTATGAAIAYAVLSSQEDSRRKEAEYNKRIHDRSLLEAEARASRNLQPTSRPKTKPVLRSSTDRDSGYYSNVSRKERSPSRWRSVSYPQGLQRSNRDYDTRQLGNPAQPKRSSTMPNEPTRSMTTRSSQVAPSSTARAPRPHSPPMRSVAESRPESYRAPKVEPPPSYRSRESNYSKREPQRNARAVDIPSSGRTIIGEDDDVSTVVPDDSISCVGSPPPRRRKSIGSSGKRRSGRGALDSRRRSIVVG